MSQRSSRAQQNLHDAIILRTIYEDSGLTYLPTRNLNPQTGDAVKLSRAVASCCEHTEADSA